MTTNPLMLLIFAHPLVIRLSVVAIVVTVMLFVHQVAGLLLRARRVKRSEPPRYVVYS